MNMSGFENELAGLYEAFGRKDAFISLNKAAKYCGCDSRTLLSDESFPVRKLGNRYKVPLIGFARWLAC